MTQLGYDCRVNHLHNDACVVLIQGVERKNAEFLFYSLLLYSLLLLDSEKMQTDNEDNYVIVC